jgi:hypothetical protein
MLTYIAIAPGRTMPLNGRDDRDGRAVHTIVTIAIARGHHRRTLVLYREANSHFSAVPTYARSVDACQCDVGAMTLTLERLPFTH